jgi:small GTP-binding protein
MKALVRVVICGQTGVGKTAFGQRLQNDKFVAEPRVTVGGQSFDIDIGDLVISFWDTAGQERYLSIVPVYFRNASVVIFAYSIDSRASLDSLKIFQGIFEQAGVDGARTVAVGLKRDLDSRGERQVSFGVAEEFLKANISPTPEFVIEVSSMNGDGIENFKALLKGTIQKVDRPAEETVNLKAGRKGRKRCC